MRALAGRGPGSRDVGEPGGSARVRAEASAALGGVPRVDVGSRVLIAEGGSQGPFDTARDSAAFLLGAPPSSELEAALEDNPTAAARFIVDDLVVALALGLLSFSTPEASASQPTELEAAVDITLSPAEATLWRDAFVSFLDPEPLGPGMEAIRLLVTSGETTFLDQEFDLVDDAATFLDDRVVELDGLFTVDDEGEFSLRIALTALGSAPMSKFGLDFLVGATPVPEPDSAWLGAVGLAGLLLVSRSRRPSH